MKKETVENIKKEFLAFKSKAGKPAFIACFGKTFVNEHEESYKISEEIAETIVEQGFGVIHGGYIGSMEAVSRGANVAIAKDQKKNQFWNIGVPMKTFDDDIKRSESMHLPSAEDILDRKRILVEMSDACVVLPVGGIGTLLEVLDVFHMYQIAEKFGATENLLVRSNRASQYSCATQGQQ